MLEMMVQTNAPIFQVVSILIKMFQFPILYPTKLSMVLWLHFPVAIQFNMVQLKVIQLKRFNIRVQIVQA